MTKPPRRDCCRPKRPSRAPAHEPGAASLTFSRSRPTYAAGASHLLEAANLLKLARTCFQFFLTREAACRPRDGGQASGRDRLFALDARPIAPSERRFIAARRSRMSDALRLRLRSASA